MLVVIAIAELRDVSRELGKNLRLRSVSSRLMYVIYTSGFASYISRGILFADRSFCRGLCTFAS